MRANSLEDIKAISQAAYDFLTSNDLSSLPDGRYDVSGKIFAHVERYNTQSRSQRQYEAHRKYVDIQYIVSGKEIISVCPITDLRIVERYSEQRDVAFYLSNSSQKGESCRDYLLEEGKALIFYPEDGHMPCVSPSDEEPSAVKKVVIKIPLSFFKQIKYLVMDVDGTLTDGKIYMGTHGEVFKAFNIKDGYGIHDILAHAGITPIIITGRSSDILQQRCEELGIKKVFQGVHNKKEMIIRLMKEASDNPRSVAYIGDDLNDIECMTMIKDSGGLVGCPSDAVEPVKAVADYICAHAGGNGAVREFIDWFVMK